MNLRSRAARLALSLALAAGLAVSGIAGVGIVGPAPASASNGYVETETTTYTVDPADRRLDVTIDVDFRNTHQSTAGSAYYFTGLYVWVEHAATHLATRADAGSTSLRHVRRSGAFDQYLVNFGQPVYDGQRRRVRVTYQLPSGAPRSSSDIRIGKALASFCVVGQGDDGGTTKVVIPSAYKVTITGGSSTELKPVTGTGGSSGGSGGSGTATWSTGLIDQPYAFWSCLSATNDNGYATSSTTSPGGREIDLQAWPEDPKWLTEVEHELGPILTKLEAIVGRELPGHGPIVVREFAGSELGNYAGFFNPETGVIVLGEDLGQSDVVAHELSHAWFNGQTFFSTWMSEGMAEWARISTVTDSCPQPSSYPGTGAPNLENWQFAGPRATATDVAVVQYQYRAACYLVSTLAAKAGADHWRAVLKALLDDQLAYQAPGLVLTHPQIPANWRQWLDAVDELGLVPAGDTNLDFAQNLLAQYGITTDTAALANRSRARAHYHKLLAELAALGGAVGWTMPEAILRPMSEWGFGVAESAMGEADAIRASVAQADAAMPGFGAEDGPVRMLFEQAKTVDDLKAAAALAADQASAAGAIAATGARIAAPRDTLAQVGLAGTDLDTPLAAALNAAKAGDTATAQADVASVNGLLDGAAEQGIIRIGLGVIVALVLLVAVAFVVLRRRQAAQPVPLGPLPEEPADLPPEVPAHVPPEVPPADPS